MNDQEVVSKLSRWKGVGLIMGIVGLVALGIGIATNRQLAMQSYLFGWYFWATVTLGCFGLLCLHNTLKSSWSLSVLRMLEAGGGPEAILLCGLGLIPIVLNMSVLYPWAQPDIVAHDHVLQLKAWYLNPTGFVVRNVFYFVIWMVMANSLRKASRKQDETLDKKFEDKRFVVGPVGMVVYFVSLTFAVTDWVMSLEKYWFSSMLPMLQGVGAALAALALVIILLLSNRDQEPYQSIITPALVKDLGNMCFATTMFWQYLTLSQFLITYAGNLPEEVPYYMKRNMFGWEWLIIGITIFQFFVPFTLLLFPRMKRYAKNLLAIAALIFVVRIFDCYWTVIPSLRSSMNPNTATSLTGSLSVWQDYAAFFGFAGVWFAAFGYQISKASILPKHDTRLLEVANAH